MIELKNSGLPLYMDEASGMLTIGGSLKYGGYSRKTAGQMTGLLMDETGLTDRAGEAFYDVYRDIAFPQDQPLLQSHQYRYDITIVMPGLIGGECKKTSGHYHGWTPEKKNTYAEVYEVLKGTALYVLQKSPDFDDPDPGQAKVEDLILVTVPEGRTLLVPPDYGHCSVNIGSGPLVFSNLAYVPCPIHYDPVRHYHGMGVYISRGSEGISFAYNKRYSNLPAARFATVKDNPDFGIREGLPVYKSFCETPEAFDFLAHPDNYTDEIMQMLMWHDCLVQP
ncbi:MAG: hypothetical protein J6S83_08820 [Lachnospiraceae bacterium]|nr:hypothetical protein [Lachnospiraceae bacterium]